MLCSTCDSITLFLACEDTEVEIRRYSNLHELRSAAETCDFCTLLHKEAQRIEEPNEGEYCKQSWGIEFFSLLLGLSPIIVTHRSHCGEHNVFISCFLDAQNTPGYPGGPISLTWRSILGGIYVSEKSDFAYTVLGRPFSSNVSEDEHICLARAWYDECRLEHDLCRTRVDQNFMPRRVLDLEPDKCRNGAVRLLVGPHGFKASYATLSYCWGEAMNLRLTQDLLHNFTTEGILLSDLPATIKDACKLCNGIGIRYLWVCSLCILQDSENDWTEQSSAMATIYNCSELTISAANSQNCNSGMLGNRSRTPVPFATIAGQAPGRTRGLCCVRARLSEPGFKEPTELRAWTLQENLLSRRLLTQGTVQMSWQCGTSSCNPSGTVQIPLPGMQDIFPCPLLEYPMDLYDNDQPECRPDTILIQDVWRRLVLNYCHRKLSLSKDKLPAISGLAKWLSNGYLMSDTYLAGLWRSQLPRGLLWYNDLAFPASIDQASRPEIYRAPTWTWASLDSNCLEWLDTSSESITSTVSDYQLSYKSSDPFGEVFSGYLDIQAPIKQGWLVPNGAYPECFDFWDDVWKAELEDRRPSHQIDSLGRAYLDVYDTMDIFIAHRVDREERTRSCTCLRITAKAGLLLNQTVGRDRAIIYPQWQRVGLVMFKERAATWWQDAPRENVRLI